MAMVYGSSKRISISSFPGSVTTVVDGILYASRMSSFTSSSSLLLLFTLLPSKVDDFYDDDEKMMRARTKRRGEDEGSTREVMVTFCCEEKQGDEAPLSGCGKCHVQNEVL
jgi:hypothetical protein